MSTPERERPAEQQAFVDAVNGLVKSFERLIAQSRSPEELAAVLDTIDQAENTLRLLLIADEEPMLR